MRLEYDGVKLKKSRAQKMTFGNTNVRFENVRTRLGNVRAQKFFSEDDKTRHLQVHLLGSHSHRFERIKRQNINHSVGCSLKINDLEYIK